MKHFLLVIDAQVGFMVKGVTDLEEATVNTLLKSNCFDCVISSIYQNLPDSNIIRFMGWNKLLTKEEQKVTDIVAAHTNHFVYKNTYSAYSKELVDLLIQENNGSLPECIFIVGFDLDCCVLMTAADLFENLVKDKAHSKYKLLENVDILIDGPFIEAEKSLELKFKGSRNQRTIDVAKSLAEGKAVLSDSPRWI